MTLLDDVTIPVSAESAALTAYPTHRAPHTFYEAARPTARPLLVIESYGRASPTTRRMVLGAVRQINELRTLPEGWDGGRARQVTDSASLAAAQVAEVVSIDHGARPQIFPLPDGGLQVEWHFANNDVEVEVDEVGGLHVLAVNAAGEVVVDAEAEDVYTGATALTATRRFLHQVVRPVQGLPSPRDEHAGTG